MIVVRAVLALLALALSPLPPILVFGLPMTLVATRIVRTRPTWRTGIAVACSLLNALLSGPALAVGAVWATLESESEGAAAGIVVFPLIGLVYGSLVALVVTPPMVLLATRQRPAPTAVPAAVDPRLGAWTLAAAVAALVIGVGTSVIGVILSVSMGMLSLAAALVLVRPVALAFVALHLLLALLSALAIRRHAAPVPTRAAMILSVVGILLAGSIAAFGPALYERALGSAGTAVQFSAP